MYGEKLVHGRKLVELLESSDAIPTQSSIILPEKVNGYNRRAYCFFYGTGIDTGIVFDTGIVLMEWEVKPKKHEAAAYHSLSAVNLSEVIINYLSHTKNKHESQDYGNIAKRAIDDMIKRHVAGIPLLLTHDYVIAEGDMAARICIAIENSLGTKSPKANELASIIKQYERKPCTNAFCQSRNPISRFANSYKIR